ncbi:hypothetical protein GJ496_010350 [Pomphorhynchus laevis]|nr:hypothetical protein GJ496_010350 [Pomphorhynchus laevis]
MSQTVCIDKLQSINFKSKSLIKDITQERKDLASQLQDVQSSLVKSYTTALKRLSIENTCRSMLASDITVLKVINEAKRNIKQLKNSSISLIAGCIVIYKRIINLKGLLSNLNLITNAIQSVNDLNQCKTEDVNQYKMICMSSINTLSGEVEVKAINVLKDKMNAKLEMVDRELLDDLNDNMNNLDEAKRIVNNLMKIGRCTRKSMVDIFTHFFNYNIEQIILTSEISSKDCVQRIENQLTMYNSYKNNLLCCQLMNPIEIETLKVTFAEHCYSLILQKFRLCRYTSATEFLSAVRSFTKLRTLFLEFCDGKGYFENPKDISPLNILKDYHLNALQELRTFICNEQWIQCPAFSTFNVHSLSEFSFMSTRQSESKDNLLKLVKDEKLKQLILINDIKPTTTNSSLFIIRSIGKSLNMTIFNSSSYAFISTFIKDLIELYCHLIYKLFVDKFCPYTYSVNNKFSDGMIEVNQSFKHRLQSDSAFSLQSRSIALDSIKFLLKLLIHLPLSDMIQDFDAEHYLHLMSLFHNHFESLQTPVLYGVIYWAFDSAILINNQNYAIEVVFPNLVQQLNNFEKLFESVHPELSAEMRKYIWTLLLDRIDIQYSKSEKGIRTLLSHDIKKRILKL